MYKKLTEEEKKALERFPKYDDTKPETWVGSKEYWESIFETEKNRDPELHEAFSQLHEEIVNMVIQFCEKHELKNIDAFYVGADGLKDNYGYHTWQCCTDSYMTMHGTKKENGFEVRDKDPFLHEI